MTLPPSHPRLSKRPFSLEELLADGIVHAISLVAGLIAFAVLLAKVATTGDLGRIASLAIYAAGFFLMFGFSLAYNVTPPSPLKWLLRRFDHASIYAMIAGTYTALLATGAAREWGPLLLALVWIGAAGGVVIKFLFPGRLDRLSILFFLILGGAGVVARAGSGDSDWVGGLALPTGVSRPAHPLADHVLRFYEQLVFNARTAFIND